MLRTNAPARSVGRISAGMGPSFSTRARSGEVSGWIVEEVPSAVTARTFLRAWDQRLTRIRPQRTHIVAWSTLTGTNLYLGR
jgi:hypothetical protein